MHTVYLIEDHRNKPYVGVTSKTPEERLEQHKRDASRGSDCHLHKAMRRYGEKNYEITSLDTAKTKERAYELERDWIKRLGTYEDWGYNMTLGGDTSPTENPEIREKISETVAGENHHYHGENLSEEHREKISVGLKGRERPQETRQKISAAHTNKEISQETRQKMSAAHMSKELSEKHKRRISEALKGREFCEEHRQKIREAKKGKERSEETKKKLRGENGSNAKLSSGEAAEVKYLAQEEQIEQKKIGKVYGIAVSTVSEIKNEHSWAHVEPKAPNM